jgi:hypothetical protein
MKNGKVLNIKSENITNVEIAVDDHFLLLRGDFENNVDGKIVLVKVKLNYTVVSYCLYSTTI